jgi:DNA-binding NarL/FixJ family response regulator
VIIMDLAMPDTDGFSATAEISRVAPEVAVLVLTMSDDDVTVTKAMRAGARGYLLKGATKEEILRAVTAVADGQAIFGPTVAQGARPTRCQISRRGSVSSADSA